LPAPHLALSRGSDRKHGALWRSVIAVEAAIIANLRLTAAIPDRKWLGAAATHIWPMA